MKHTVLTSTASLSIDQISHIDLVLLFIDEISHALIHISCLHKLKESPRYILPHAYILRKEQIMCET